MLQFKIGESSPDVEVIVDNYPVSVKQLNGRLVPVVQVNF